MTSGHLSPRTVDALRLWHDGAEELAVVQHNGIRVDLDYLQEKQTEFRETEARLTAALKESELWALWRKQFGQKALITSDQQLSKMLFDVLKLDPPPGTRRNKSGLYAVSEEILAKVDHPFVRDLGPIRKVRKMASTYIDGWLFEQVHGFIHPFFNLHKASSFRSSSEAPNFQNVPIRHPINGPLIRRGIIPRDGNRIIELDFSGAEVRVAGCCTKDPVLMNYLAGAGDMHHDVAKDLFLLTDSQVDKKTTRHWAKNRFVFAQFYGSVWFQCAPALWDEVTQSTAEVPGTGLTVREHLKSRGIKRLGSCDPKTPPVDGSFAKLVMDAERVMWDKRFKVFTKWKKDLWDDYQQTGYVHMVTGFTSAQHDLRRNQVLNFPIQGPAFHCLLWCLVRIQRELRRYKMRAKVIGQVHDSLLGDVPDRETQNYLEIAYRTMTKDIMKAWKWLIVPLEAEADVTPVDGSWADKVAWECGANDIWQPTKRK